LKIRKESEISVGYLYKMPMREESISTNIGLNSEAHLPYTKGKFKVSKNINISGEFAYSTIKRAEGTAYMAQAEVNFDKLNGNLAYMKASPQFAGYFTNTHTLSGYLQYRLTKRISVLANYMQDAKNFQRDTLFLAAPYRKFLQYGIQYKYLDKGSILINHGFQKYQDRLEPKQFDYYERFFRVNVDQRIGIFQINLEGQFGNTDNYLTGFNGHSSLYAANLSFEKFRTFLASLEVMLSLQDINCKIKNNFITEQGCSVSSLKKPV
jgi:hypothetical protein